MKQMWVETVKVPSGERGQGLVEYALILVLVSIAAIMAMSALGGQVDDTFAEIASVLSGGPAGIPANGGSYGHWPNSAYDYCEGGNNDTPLQLFHQSAGHPWIAGHPSIETPTNYIRHSMLPNYPTTCGDFIAEGHADLR